MTTKLLDAIYDLAALYPRYELPDRTAELYVRQLSDLPEPAVLDALDRCGKTCTFFPSLAEIRKEVGETAANADEIAESAWPKVREQIRYTGYMGSPRFDDPLIAEVVASLGWRTICGMDATEAQEKFIFTYRSLRKRAVGSIQRGNFPTTDVDTALDGGKVRALPGKGQVAS